MKMCKFMYMLLLTLITVAILLMATGTNAISCSDAVNALIPCGSYLIGSGSNDPSTECCSSAQSLNKMGTTVQSRRQVCDCLKSTGSSLGVKPALATRLVQVCNLNLDIPVTPNVDCNSISAYGYEETP